MQNLAKLKRIIIILIILITAVLLLHIKYDVFGLEPLQFNTYPDLASKAISTSDYQKLLSLHQECFEEAKRQNLYAYLLQVKYPDSNDTMKKLIKDRVNDYLTTSRLEKLKGFRATENVTLVQKKHTIIGLYNCREDNDITNGSIMIFNVCLDPSLRGKGFGSAIIKHAISRCSQTGKDLTLTVYKDNTPAIKLYEKSNFKIIEPSRDLSEDFAFFNKYLMKYIHPSN